MKNLKRVGVVYFLVVLSAVPNLAFAYIDPSVSTYAIQAIAGIVVAVGAFAAIAWRRAKKKLQDKLGIDMDANKEKEKDVTIFDEED